MIINETKFGLGSCYFQKGHKIININRNLKKYPRLYKYVIDHELGHIDKFDIGHEFKFKWQVFGLMYFILIHPSTWTDLTPVSYKDKTLTYDKNLFILWGIALVLLFIILRIVF
jgi:hypothetical protein